MKNKIRLISLMVLGALSLTACDFLFPEIGGSYSYFPVWDGQAHKADIVYKDYAANSLYDFSVAPSQDNAKLLIIPVWFDESYKYINPEMKDTIREDIQTSFFGSAEETGWQSVKSYYEIESHGTLTLSGTVSEWYGLETTVRLSDYRASISNTENLVKMATEWYFANHDDSRTSYDCDKDGYLDGVVLIYGAPDYTAVGPAIDQNYKNYTNLWAYTNWVQGTSTKNIFIPGAKPFIWASYSFMYGQQRVESRTGDKRFYSGDTTHCLLDCHTYIHEIGHLFGLTDYYDYSDTYIPAGGFSMQDRNIGGHDPFSVYALGWAEAYIPTYSTTINLQPFTTSGEIIILTPGFNVHNSPFDEYLIIEYYTRDGLNQFDATNLYMNSPSYTKGPERKGIRLWHVDARLLYSRTGSLNPNNFTTNPKSDVYKMAMMMSNTYAPAKSGYLSPLGTTYADYNLLHLIRNDTNITH
ncbi:MAG: hypothetical protein GX813_04175 [Erysipelotrichia bacterium]|nr:hypothetical protein [Erysipelotrichia bacterium]